MGVLETALGEKCGLHHLSLKDCMNNYQDDKIVTWISVPEEPFTILPQTELHGGNSPFIKREQRMK